MNIKKGILYVFVANGIGLIISLITSFFMPKFLAIETYSNIKLFQLIINYVGILHLGFSDGMYLRLGGKKINEIDKKELVSEFNTFKIFQIIINAIVLIISIILKNKFLMIVSLSVLPINIINYLRNLYQATGLYDWYSKFLTLNNLMLFGINMIFLLIMHIDNAYIYIIGQIIVYYINWIIVETILRLKIFNKVKGHVSIKYMVDNIKSGILLMFGNFCTVIFTSIDRIFVKFLLGTIMFAFYSFAVSIENLLNVFITPISVTMYNYICKNNDAEKIKRIKGVLLIFISFLISAAYPAKWIVFNYLEKYKEAVSLVFILFAGQFFSSIVRCIFNNLYKAEKRQKRYFTIIIIVSILAFITDFIGYTIYNSNETFAIATLITSIVWFIIGEKDFKNSRYTMQGYFFMTISICIYLYTGLFIDNAIIGFMIYIITIIILMYFLLNKEIKLVITEGINLINKIIKNKKKKHTK